MAEFNWEFASKDYEINTRMPKSLQTSEHPLMSNTMVVIEGRGTRSKPCSSNSSSKTSSTLSLIDPLGQVLDGTDPLSQFLRQERELSDRLSQLSSDFGTGLIGQNNTHWNLKRLAILNRFTTLEKLSISTSFLAGTAGSNEDSSKTRTNLSEKMKHRLEQLDDFEDGSVRHMMNLSQQEYTARIEQLNNELVKSWNEGQRVKALKIAIQCSKTLGDTSVLQFYPSQFVLITDILDTFGNLVFERLRSKADIDSGIKPTSERVCECAKETCQNWFFKIASIRELLPRLYVEMAILKCYCFFSHKELNQALIRIPQMIRGVGDPLVAIYARCYLVRVGILVSTEKEYMKKNFNDFLSVYHMIFSGSLGSELNWQHIDVTSYLGLYEPALDWIFHALICKTSECPDDIFIKCKDIKSNGLLFISILNSFEPEYIESNATHFVQIVSNSSTEGFSKAKLFCSLGKCITKCSNISDQTTVVLKTALTTINTFTDPDEFISSIESWIQLMSQYFSIIQINDLFGVITTRMTRNKTYENYYLRLQAILDKVIKYCREFEKLLILNNFLPFLDLFQKVSVKLEVCKSIMTFYKNSSQNLISDPVIKNTLMYICGVLNDSVKYVHVVLKFVFNQFPRSVFTVGDELRQIGDLVSNFVRKIDYESDFEQQLMFYVEARAAFFNLDAVLETLVYLVNKIADKTRQMIGGTHTNKTSGFVKACIAYCLITIPSVSSTTIQMNLYLLSGEVAVSNCCLEQADTCFETALKLVPSLPRAIDIDGKLRSTENYLMSYICNLLSILVVIPDSPEQGVLYLIRLLLDVLKKLPLDPHSTGATNLYLHILDALYVQTFTKYPYHIINVVSNDELYGGDPKFIAEVNSIGSRIVEQFLNQLKSLDLSNQLRAQANLALNLFLRVIRYGNVCKENMFQLALKLWNLAAKNKDWIEAKSLVKALERIEEIKSLISTENEQRSQRLESIIETMKTKIE